MNRMNSKSNIKIISLILTVFTFFTLTSCNKTIELEYDNKTDITTLKENESTIDAMLSSNIPYDVLGMFSTAFYLDDLKEEGIVDVLRYNKGKYYSVTKIKDRSYLFLLYDKNNNGYRVVDSLLVSTLLDKKVLSNVKEGTLLTEVEALDETAYLMEKSYSTHRLSDKSKMYITYRLENHEYVVSEIEKENNNDKSVLYYLLEKDFKVIS